MRIESMIYIYGAVCLSMILFNVVYNLLLKSSRLRLERRCGAVRVRLLPQLIRLRQGLGVEEKHLVYLEHALRREKNLMAFDQVLKDLLQRGDEELETAYLEQIQPAILYLAVIYQRRDAVSAAYFSYVLSRYMAPRHLSIHSVQGVLLDYMRKENLYCQVNALQALCRFGSAENILTALQILDQGSVFVHEKILTEGLLTFTGDHDELIRMLWGQLDGFSQHTQLAISNYIRFRSGAYTAEMFAVLQDESRGKELRLSAIRYFGRYYYRPAQDTLLDLARQKDPELWEYTTVSVSALARYPGEATVAALKEALHSSNWYVRYDAAVSLQALHVDYMDLMDVITGNDRYAREMMVYRMESDRMQKAGV